MLPYRFHLDVINRGYDALQHSGVVKRVSVIALLGLVAAATAAPSAALVLINEPAQLPKACFDVASSCDRGPLAATAPAPVDTDTPNPLVAVGVGVLALALAFGRRSGLQEVVS